MPWDEVRYNREKLYEEVWSEPTREVAKKYGVSDVALAKTCRKLKVPIPTRGYWRRKETGQNPRKPPLPKFEGQQEIVRSVHRPDWQNRAADEDPAGADEFEAAIAFEKAAVNRVLVPEVLDSMLPVVARTEKSLRSAKADEHGFAQPRASGCLEVRLSLDTIGRAMLIFDALLRAFDSRGWPVTDDEAGVRKHVTVLGEKLDFGLEEILDRNERPFTKEELRAKAARPWEFRNPVYEYRASGRLTLRTNTPSLSGLRSSWSDGEQQRLETRINSFMAGLIRIAQWIRRDREERQREEERRRIAAIERARKRALWEEEKGKFEKLERHVTGWHQAQRIRAYVEALRQDIIQRDGCVHPGSEDEKWIMWALSQADRLDPLKDTPPSVLDDPEFRR